MRDYNIDEVPRALELENIYAALKELKAYQDSGLTPEDVQELQNKIETKEIINQLYITTTSMLGHDKDSLVNKVNELQKQLAGYQALGAVTMKVEIDGKQYAEKEELFFETNRLIKQDKKDMDEAEQYAVDAVMKRLQNILFR